MAKASCDNCGKVRHLSHGYAGSLESWQCWECTGNPPTCDVCGEELEDGKCLWCFGDPLVDQIRTLCQKMIRENEAQLRDLKELDK